MNMKMLVPCNKLLTEEVESLSTTVHSLKLDLLHLDFNVYLNYINLHS